MTMRIAFFGLDGTSNHDHVGGMNSMVRRLARQLALHDLCGI